MNINNVLVATTPWFFRYWIFAHLMATTHVTYEGLGSSRNIRDSKLIKESKIPNVVIDSEECLSKEGVINKLKNITNFIKSADSEHLSKTNEDEGRKRRFPFG